MKRLIRGSNDNLASVEDTVIHGFGKDSPGTGCSFIAKDGTFVNIYPKIDTHEDLAYWVQDNLGIEVEKYPDEETFIRTFGWIRLRKDPVMLIVELPINSPTSDQWYSLEDWLNWVEEQGVDVPLYLSVCDDYRMIDVEYPFGSDYFAKDILQICKKYYTTGKLYS